MFSYLDLTDVAPICQEGTKLKPSWLNVNTKITLPVLADYLTDSPLGARFLPNIVARVAIHVGMRGNGRDDDDFINDLLYIKQRHPQLTRCLQVAHTTDRLRALGGVVLTDSLVVVTRTAQSAAQPIVLGENAGTSAMGSAPIYLLFGAGPFTVTSERPNSTRIIVTHRRVSLHGSLPTYNPATGWAGGINQL